MKTIKNLVKFIEIPAVDFARVVKFYETVLGVKLTVCDSYETEKMALFSNCSTEPTVAISWAADFRPSNEGVLVSLCVESIEAALVLINANGGKTVPAKTKIEADGMGYFAQFADSEGNGIGLYADI